MAAQGRQVEPVGQETLGPAGSGSRWPGPGGTGAESGAGSGAMEEEEDMAAASGLALGGVNLFANDGSFLELFKRKMAEEEEWRQQRQQQQSPDKPPAPPGDAGAAASAAGGEPKRKSGPGLAALSFVGKRRGGNKLALKTGMIAKKRKAEEKVMTSKGDAWTKYMEEVKKYKAHQCSDDSNIRPLVK